MKRVLVVFILCGHLVGCGGGSGSGAKPTETSSTTAPPAPTTSSVWGSLECQKNKNCENRVLNIGKDQWLALLKTFAERKVTYTAGEEASFYCGSDFYEWVSADELAGGVTGVVAGVASPSKLKSDDLNHLIQFAGFVLNFKKCEVNASTNLQIENFFNKYINGELK